MSTLYKFNFGPYSTKISNCNLEQLFTGADLVIADENTALLAPQAPDLVLAAGEAHKNWDSIESILNSCVAKKLRRNSLILGFGGGVITDMTSFAAAIYMRGCQLILVPTSLLAMIDASIGGKSGFDFQGYKNLVGAFYPAAELRICPDLLQSLPQKEFIGGMAEVIKHAFLGSEELLQVLQDKSRAIKQRDPLVLQDMINLAIAVKARIVEQDLYEKNIRAHLNLGHTFAHALEKITNFSVSHGEAVAWGMHKALILGYQLGETSMAYYRDCVALLELYGLLNYYTVDPDELLRAFAYDKKKAGASQRIIIQKSLTVTKIVDLDNSTIKNCLVVEHL